jgi:hypothetical protein
MRKPIRIAQPPPAPPLVFGAGGSANAHLLIGWASPEPGFCWTTGTGATLTADMPGGAGDLFLELSLNPFTTPSEPSRALQVTADEPAVDGDALEGQGIVGYLLPPDIAGKRVTIGLHHDPAPSPAALGLSTDPRSLGFMVFSLRAYRGPHRPRADVTVLPPLALPQDSTGRLQAVLAATGLTPRALAEQCESLGHNCEFGMLQRHLEAEPLGLLRFAGITLDDLLAGLDDGFADLGAEMVVATHPLGTGGSEFLVQDSRYRLSLHTTLTTDTHARADIETRYRTHLPFLGRHLRGRLAEGSHLYVFQRPGQLTQSQAMPLWNRLQAHGPNALLYVDQDPNLPSGAVEQRGHGLYHGRLARMAPHANVGLLDVNGWLSLCANAYRLWCRDRPNPAVS